MRLQGHRARGQLPQAENKEFAPKGLLVPTFIDARPYCVWAFSLQSFPSSSSLLQPRSGQDPVLQGILSRDEKSSQCFCLV